MFPSRVRAAGLAVAASLGLSACTTYGGLGYGGYGSGISVGVGNAGYYDRYCDPRFGYSPYGYRSTRYGYSPYGYGYGYSPYRYGYGYSPYGYAGADCGWHDGFYYPGAGYYVYGGDGRRYHWTDEQRRYWEQRREQARREGRVLNRIGRQVQSQQDYGTAGPQDFGSQDFGGAREQRVRRVNRDSGGTGMLGRVQRRIERRQQQPQPE